jgi:hypothetical protein
MNYNRWRKNELSPKSRLRSVKHIKEHSHTQAPKCINEDELPQQESRQQNRPDQCQQRRVFECHGRSMHAASVSSNFCSCLGTALCSHPATAEWRQGRRDDPCPWVPQDKHNQIMRVNLLPPRGPTCQFLPGMLFLQQRLTLCHPRRKDRRCSFHRDSGLGRWRRRLSPDPEISTHTAVRRDWMESGSCDSTSAGMGMVTETLVPNLFDSILSSP